MKMKIVIALFILFAQWHDLNAMGERAQYQETVVRLGDWLSADSKEHQEAQPALATIPLDSPKNKKQDNELADPITLAIQQSIIDRERRAKFESFFAVFKHEANLIWKDRDTIENKFLHEYLADKTTEQVKQNKDQYATEVQNRIDVYYLKRYEQLYQKIYREHFKAQAPAAVAQEFARQVYYSGEQRYACCVIL
jgi:hypothetical protein